MHITWTAEGNTLNWQLISFRFCYCQQSIYWDVSTCQHCDRWTPQQHTERKEMIRGHRGELSLTDTEILFSALSVLYKTCVSSICFLEKGTVPELLSLNLLDLQLWIQNIGFVLSQEQIWDSLDSHSSFVCRSETRMWPPYLGTSHINKHRMMTMKMLDFYDT